MTKTVFWSWQSDLEGRVTRELIRFALDEAINTLAAEVEEADRPTLTSDTQGVAGSPDIVATILRKIDESAVFVGDVTPIALSDGGKACANPNVLLEMGYANKALSTHRVIQVWNTAFEGATLDKLPFDMRNRRGPIAFHLPVDADKATLRTARLELVSKLTEALRLAFDQLPPPLPVSVNWQQHFKDDDDLWFDRNEPLTVTNLAHGSSKVKWDDHWPGYARLVPTNWAARPDAERSLANHPGHPALLARANSLSYGICKGGALVYWPGNVENGVCSTLAITQWFKKTGEFWGVGGGFLFKRDEDRLTLATGYIFNRWLSFLERNCALALAHGGELPIHVRMGINDLKDSWWPLGSFELGSNGYAAVEDSFSFDATLTSIEPNSLKATVIDAFNALASVYGIEAHTEEQIEALSR